MTPFTQPEEGIPIIGRARSARLTRGDRGEIQRAGRIPAIAFSEDAVQGVGTGRTWMGGLSKNFDTHHSPAPSKAAGCGAAAAEGDRMGGSMGCHSADTKPER